MLGTLEFPQSFFNPLTPRKCDSNVKSFISEHMLQIKFMSTTCEIALRWIPQNTVWPPLIISQHWCRSWFSAIRQQATTWANVNLDVCNHIASLEHNELTNNKWCSLFNFHMKCHFLLVSEIVLKLKTISTYVSHICFYGVFINSVWPRVTCIHPRIGSSLVEIITCFLFSAKPLI